MPLATRTIGSKIFAGAHVSVAGGVQNAVINSLHIGGNAFALFLKSQRKWTNPPLKTEDAVVYKAHCKEHGIESDKHVVPHGSYLVNLAHTDADRTAQAYGSFLDDLKRCHQLGIKLYNFHPGNCASSTREEAIRHLAHQLNRAHKDPDTGGVITVLETMASAGNTIGSTFSELASIIKLVNDKSRVAVCLDTCHVFAAGYDLRTPEAFKATIEQFDKDIGLKYLRAFHVNDSKAPLGSHKDLHANIGTGFLGLRAFHNLVNEPRLWGLPLVLETPIGVKNEKGKEVDDHGIYAREIKLLESLVGMDPESSEFTEMESKLHAKGESERARIQDQVDRKAIKDKKGGGKAGAKKPAKAKPTKGKKKKIETSDEEGDSGEDTA
ncbi:AP endonuclease [Pseudovirgaria hyperparasitica]|uniref:Apurinic-apyrimidinic endonuclease 1 n=1 Tax=Pseudovirgaria hyperparasitica TaxID=470096 RepID=A0A6A6VTZ0_9PEZI|nr:AP endonuclease [Pseudovirgaria hyperparasitica]KAF2753615.1 AP endonuclease [Pseudovirgaria hyperparasitica]